MIRVFYVTLSFVGVVCVYSGIVPSKDLPQRNLRVETHRKLIREGLFSGSKTESDPDETVEASPEIGTGVRP